MKPPFKPAPPRDASSASLITDLEIIRTKAPGLLPPAIKSIIRSREQYRSLHARLMAGNNRKYGYRPLVDAVFSDLCNAERGYLPQTSEAVHDYLPGLARPGEQLRLVRRLLRYLKKVKYSLYVLTHESCASTPFPAPFPGRSRFMTSNEVIIRPIYVTGGGVVKCPKGSYRLHPLPNSRTLLRIQAAALTFETLTIPYKAVPVGIEAAPRLQDLFILAYAQRLYTTAKRARRDLDLPIQGPSRPAERLTNHIDRILMNLPVEEAIRVLKSEEPNLELRALTAWTIAKNCHYRRATRELGISARTLRRWRAGGCRPHPLQRVAAAVAEADFRAVLLDPEFFRLAGITYLRPVD